MFGNVCTANSYCALQKNAHTNFVGHAEAAVSLLQDARAQGVTIRDETITEANELLRLAREDYAKLEVANRETAEGEATALEDAASASTTALPVFVNPPRPLRNKGKNLKKVRRVHSGDGDKDAPVEEYDEESGQWAERGPVEEGEEVELVGSRDVVEAADAVSSGKMDKMDVDEDE